jgi:antirestriction protein ArdC
MPHRERHDRQAVQQERDARLAEALTRLDSAVTAIQDSDTFRRYLDVQARFHRYSYGNVLLILAQRPDATQIAGYQAWKAIGRQVRRGERGIRVLVPMPLRDRDQQQHEPTDSANEPDPSTEQRGRLRFGVGTVFDIDQTDGEPLPVIDVPVLTGDEGTALYGRLEAVAHDQGLTVQRGSLRLVRPETMGFYSPTERLIVVREAASSQMAKTLAHELAHHLGQRDGSPPVESTPQEETIAEAVAYVACRHFDVETGERSFPYIATWSREPHVLRQALGEIQARGSLLIGALDR